MNVVQERLADLEWKGWSLAAIADEMGIAYNTVQKWKAGDRYPSTAKAVLQSLEILCKRKRVPKRRRLRARSASNGRHLPDVPDGAAARTEG